MRTSIRSGSCTPGLSTASPETIKATHRSNVASILADASHHPKRIRHPDIRGSLKNTAPDTMREQARSSPHRERRVGQDFNGKSGTGQKRSSRHENGTSALPPNADTI